MEPLLKDFSAYYRLWNRQLQREFYAICYQYRLTLDPPVFAISESKRQLGLWRPETREIRISSFLIRNYPWDITLQILKHEIAHQVCSEMYHDQTGGHGELFLKTCAQLGLPERFSHAQGDLSLAGERRGCGSCDDASRKIVEKIRKLLALSQSANEHEAALAMKMAGRLLEKHNLAQLPDDSQHNFVYLIINRKKKRIAEYQRRIIAILTKHFHVEAVSSSLYDPGTDEIYKTFELFGKQANVQIAEYCYDFLEQKLSALWQERAHPVQGNGRIAKKSYYLGLLKGLSDRLTEQSDEAGSDARYPPNMRSSSAAGGLLVADRALQQFIRSRYPRLSGRAAGNVQIYKETYDQGIRTGRTIVLYQGIAESFDNACKLLE
ncbi:MAG: DUF2786 domain-containing protein [Desulfocapsaceae bacterium]|nr:DUF2786 domain-containing protein [Desulfocapsaceae bacterium]